MLPRLAASCVMVALVTAGLTAQDLPTQQSDDDSFEVEPPLLIPNRGNEPLPAVTADGKATVIDPDRLEKDLERAKRSAAGADRLYKMGVLAKVEVEQRALRVVRLQSELENARMALAKEEILRQEQRLAAGEISKADLAATEVALA